MALNYAAAGTSLVLKVDIDAKVGLLDGARRLADLLAELGVKASFFVSMGPDHSGRALKRLLRPGFLRKQMHSGAASAYGPLTMMYGLLLPGPVIARQGPGVINRCINEGHEVGLHGWDHVFWHDRLRGLEAPRIRLELGRAWRLFKSITGAPPASFAAPGWQATDRAYQVMTEMGLTHVSCTRGRTPFRPLVGGQALPILELPTTLPTMDEALGTGEAPSRAARRLADMVRPGELNVYTMHGEVEGRGLAPAFREFCLRLLDQGVRFVRLVDAARDVMAAGPVPAEPVVWGRLPGRAYEVAFQASALGDGSA